MAAPITPEDLYRFRWIDHVRLSPDGERVAYQVAWADSNSRQNRSRIVVRRLLDPEPIEPTAGVLRGHAPEWSPDGRKLAFISKVGAADQLFVIDLAVGGPAQQLTSVPEGVSRPQWSPDGTRLAFVGVVVSDPDAVVDDPRPPEGREQLRRAPVARVVRRLDYKHDGYGYVDGRYHHVFAVSATGGDAKQLTDGTWDVADFDWSPDSTRLVVSGNAEPGADLQRELNLYAVDLEANRVRLGGGFFLGSPIWSPKGEQIAFIAPNGLDVGLLERVWIVSLGGGGPRCLTADFDLAVNDSVINDMRAGHATRICWSSEGDRIYFVASGPGVTGVQSVDLEGKVREEIGGRRRIYDFDFANGVFAFCASDASNPGELFMLTQGAEARITDLNPWLHDRYIAEPEQHYFTAPDGWKLEGWVLKPPDHDPSRLYPAVMEIHGGPHAQYGWSFFHELQILAGQGYVVFYMNPRGSDGYGERFRRDVVRDWAGKDYLDLMSSLDQVIERTGYIDANRLGVGGGSYGGFMTNWMIGQTNRFSAAVAMRSISNLVSEYSQHDIVLWGALELGPPPWPDLDELWKRSPIRYVQNIQTPLLLSCGEMDLRCAISQSEELFGAMRFLGKTVEMVRFPEESHDLSRSGRPDRRVERLKRIAAWYERFLGTASTEADVEAETQVLPIQHDEVATPIEASGPTTVLETLRMPDAAEASPTAVLETVHVEDLPAAVEPEPDVAEAEPTVAETVVEAPEAEVEAPVIGDPYTTSALPVFPEPEPSLDAVPVAEEPQLETAEPEPVAEEVEPVAEPLEPVELEAWSEPEPEPEAVAAEAAPEPEPEPEPVEAVPVEPEPVEATAPEPMASEPEPMAVEAEPEPVVADAQPVVADAEPVMAEAEPGPGPEPVVEEPEPEPVAAQTPPPAPAKSVTSTMLRWPTNPGMQDNGSSDSDSGEAATSVIPAWQPTEMPSESRRTVSLQAMPPEAIAAGEAFAAKLSFETGPFTGRIIALPNQMVTLGRAPDNDVVVADPATSGRHGRIEVRTGAFWISDLGSTNGTLVNGEPVIEKQLADGDLIAIGQNTIRFTLE